ncbi:hypothetical protein HDE_13270 [Halotydeus destructor]|nr:hypothetical protein HDE_13270 [Halotydeus destructor]
MNASIFKNDDQFRLTTCDFNGIKIFETTRVDAIFTIPNTGQLFLIVGSLYYEYIEEANAEITYVQSGSLSDLWPGLPDNVDAATYLNGNITFFVHNFIFYGDVSRMRTGDSVTDPILSRRIISADKNTEQSCFKTYKFKDRNIADIYEEYRNQFKPIITTTSSYVTTKRLTSQRILPKSTKVSRSRSTLYVMAMILVILVLAALSIGAILAQKSKSRQHTTADLLAEDDNAETKNVSMAILELTSATNTTAKSTAITSQSAATNTTSKVNP